MNTRHSYYNPSSSFRGVLEVIVGTAEGVRGSRLRTGGSVLLLIAVVMFVGSFVTASRTPLTRDLSGCHKGIPCDVSLDQSKREDVFLLWMGATLIVFVGGVVLRSVGNRS
ncbi:MAG: hypothetical protein QOH48_2510 [Actinomycetota bacterium]|nr:hypothetical protein [Actinomycetota bacterium]